MSMNTPNTNSPNTPNTNTNTNTLKTMRAFIVFASLAMLTLFVTACPSSSSGGSSSSSGGAAADSTPPAVVTDLAGTVSGTAVGLTWTDPADADFSHLLISWEPAGGMPAQPLQVNKGAGRVNVTGLAVSTSYSFTAISVDATGNRSVASAARAEAMVTTAAASDSTPPAVVTDLAGTVSVFTTVTLTWTDPTDADFSNLLISWQPAGPTGSTMQPLSVNKGTQTATVTGLMQATDYSFTAISVDVAGNRSVASTARAAAMITTGLNPTVALFNTGASTGGFGFGSSGRCQTRLDDSSFAIGVELKSRGYTKAVLFGSTPDYNFIDLATDPDALGISGQTDTNLEARGLSYFSGTSSVTGQTMFGLAGSTTTRTVGSLVNVATGGAWQNGGEDIISIVIASPKIFWSFTRDTAYDSGNNCSGATVAVGTVRGGTGSRTTSVDRQSGVGATLPVSCDESHEVLCLAH